MKRIMLATGCALALGAAGLVAAQAYVPGGGWFARAQARSQAFAAELALDPAQQAAWSGVQRERIEFLLGLRLDLEQLKVRVRRDLADPAADLRQTAAAIEATVDRELAAHRAVRDAQLAFYDGLDAGQQAKVRAHLLERIEKLERLREAIADLSIVVQ